MLVFFIYIWYSKEEKIRFYLCVCYTNNDIQRNYSCHLSVMRITKGFHFENYFLSSNPLYIITNYNFFRLYICRLPIQCLFNQLHQLRIQLILCLQHRRVIQCTFRNSSINFILKVSYLIVFVPQQVALVALQEVLREDIACMFHPQAFYLTREMW